MIQIAGHIEKHGKMYLGWTNSSKFKGIAAQGSTEDEVIRKLLILLRIKVAFDYDLDIVNVVASELKEGNVEVPKVEWKTKNEFQLQL